MGRWGRGRAAENEAEGAADAVEPADDTPTSEPDADEPDADEPERPFRLTDLTPFLLVRAAHPRQAVVTAVAMALAAALSGRPSRELLLVGPRQQLRRHHVPVR